MHGSTPRPDADGSLEQLADPQQLLASRPSHRLFRAHPALGLEEADGRWLSGLEPHELGVSWLALPAAERRLREIDFLRALLQRAACWEDARFEAGWYLLDADERAARLARALGVRVSAESTVHGPLTQQAITALSEALPSMLRVDGGPDLTIVTCRGWQALGVWIDPWKREPLQLALEEAWWESARERADRDVERSRSEVERRRAGGRELRARLFVGWKRRASLLTSLLAAAFIADVWGDGLGQIVLAVGSALGVVAALDWLVTRWYRHAQGER